MKVLITGGTGMVGKQLALRLASRGHSVTAVGRNLSAVADVREPGIKFRKMDLESRDEVLAAIAGHEVVYHCAAHSAPWGRYDDFYRANVLGTRHVVEACERHGMQRLIHVSTPSVYFDFSDRFGIKESDPVAEKPCSHYTSTKLQAERVVQDAAQRGLETIILRPRGIFGPEDQVLLPRLLKAIEQKKLPIIGRGDNRIDLTYIDNLVDAMELCLEAPRSATGRIYNITNGEPIVLWDFIRKLVEEIGIPYRPKRTPYALMHGLAWALETHSKHLNQYREPPLTRYTVGLLAKSQTLDISAAREHLGYNPKISMKQGLQAVARSYRKRTEGARA